MSNKLISNTTMKQKLSYTYENDNNKTITLDVTLKCNHHLDQFTLENLQRMITALSINSYKKTD